MRRSRFPGVLIFLFLAGSSFVTVFAQKPLPIGAQISCAALKLEYEAAIKAGDGALVNKIGQQMTEMGCYDPPKPIPSPTPISYYVGTPQTIPYSINGPGEGQSAVLPPGKNSACKNGALLASNDYNLGNGSPLVISRDLSGKAPDVVSKFDDPPDIGNYFYGTNDHDLIAMGDGSVLFITGAFTKAPLSPKPAWFDYAYRHLVQKDPTVGFGPGARSNLLVWRSIDCGAKFSFVTEMDPALYEDGSCAYPQGSLDSFGHYDMGGSDGQLALRDPATDKLYITFRCVGREITTKNGKFALSDTALDKTLVFYSGDRGSNWSSMGFINGANWWRFGILPLKDRVAFGFQNNVVFGTQFGQKLSFGKAQPMNGSSGGFNWKPYPFNPSPSPDTYIFANVWANTLITRAGESQGILFAYPTIVGSGSNATNGYSLFFHDPSASGKYSELTTITPLSKSPSSYVMNITAIDLGTGPVLLYWLDVNASTHVGRVRGRVILDLGTYSPDFDITGDIDLTKGGVGRFYGDYHTAGGYVSRRGSPLLLGKEYYYFYPIWDDGTDGTHYAQVRVSVGLNPSEGLSAKSLNVIKAPAGSWKPTPPPVDLITFKGKLPRMRDRGDEKRRTLVPVNRRQ
ncbi:MAG: hypothetical protein JO053_09170 [Acidobacteria bacterium]|nr:hypothetical protein [Acidobacteriota bacterium]